MRRSFLVILAVAVAAAAVAVAPALAARAASIVSIKTTSGLKYNVKVLRTKAGKITIRFTNTSGIAHDVRIEKGKKQFGGTKTITKGTTSATVTLKKGTYTFYCSLPGHEAAGMKGTLTVS